ncbi:hypothetical protein PCE1_004823 [Barthelona sp. PCE]
MASTTTELDNIVPIDTSGIIPYERETDFYIEIPMLAPAAPQTIKTRYRLTNGQIQDDSRPIVVVLHGFCSSLTLMQIICDSISDTLDATVLSIDLPNHGFTDFSTEENINAGFFVQFLNAFFEAVNLNRPYYLFGHSMGGAICTAFAADQLSRAETHLKGIMLSAAAGLVVHGHDSWGMRRVQSNGMFGKFLFAIVARKFFRKMVNEELLVKYSGTAKADWYDYLFERRGFRPIRRKMRDIIATFEWDGLGPQAEIIGGHPEFPVMYFYADQDNLLSEEEVNSVWKAAIPQLQIEVLRNHPHDVYLSCPVKVGQVAAGFVAESLSKS